MTKLDNLAFGALFGFTTLLSLNCGLNVFTRKEHEYKVEECDSTSHFVHMPLITGVNFQLNSSRRGYFNIKLENLTYNLLYVFRKEYEKKIVYSREALSGSTDPSQNYEKIISESAPELIDTRVDVSNCYLYKREPSKGGVRFSSSLEGTNGIYSPTKDGIIKVPFNIPDSLVLTRVRALKSNNDLWSEVFTDEYDGLEDKNMQNTFNRVYLETIYSLKDTIHGHHIPYSITDKGDFDPEVGTKEAIIEFIGVSRSKIIKYFREKDELNLESSIKEEFGNLYISVVDYKSGMPIPDAQISITSDAPDPDKYLTWKGLSPKSLNLDYPNSWDGVNWNNGKYCKSSGNFDKLCNFFVLKSAKHKIAIKHNNYYESIDEFVPNIDGMKQEFRLYPIGIEVELNIFGGRGKRVRK